MSCYFRHMKETLAAAGITITDANKRTVDQTIHGLVGVTYKDCMPTWRKVKLLLANEQERSQLINNLKRKRPQDQHHGARGGHYTR